MTNEIQEKQIQRKLIIDSFYNNTIRITQTS
jgi:hypothetical protein